MLKKDSRYESLGSLLEKSERERFFDDHIDSLVAKKKGAYIFEFFFVVSVEYQYYFFLNLKQRTTGAFWTNARRSA